jgi:DNA-binding transcriptional regulator YbjK
MSPAFDPVSLPQAELRRRQILAAVLRVIGTGGVDAVTHRRVAAEAKVPLGSTTYHFDSRDALILEAFRSLIATQNEELLSLGLDVEDPDLDDFIDVTVAHTEKAIADEVGRRAEYELILYGASDVRLAREYWAWQRNVESLVAEWLERVRHPRPMEMAGVVMSLIRAYELERLGHRPLSADAFRRRLRSVLVGDVE